VGKRAMSKLSTTFSSLIQSSKRRKLCQPSRSSLALRKGINKTGGMQVAPTLGKRLLQDAQGAIGRERHPVVKEE